MSKNAPQCEGAFLVVEKIIKKSLKNLLTMAYGCDKI